MSCRLWQLNVEVNQLEHPMPWLHALMSVEMGVNYK